VSSNFLGDGLIALQSQRISGARQNDASGGVTGSENLGSGRPSHDAEVDRPIQEHGVDRRAPLVDRHVSASSMWRAAASEAAAPEGKRVSSDRLRPPMRKRPLLPAPDSRISPR